MNTLTRTLSIIGATLAISGSALALPAPVATYQTYAHDAETAKSDFEYGVLFACAKLLGRELAPGVNPRNDIRADLISLEVKSFTNEGGSAAYASGSVRCTTRF